MLEAAAVRLAVKERGFRPIRVEHSNSAVVYVSFGSTRGKFWQLKRLAAALHQAGGIFSEFFIFFATVF